MTYYFLILLILFILFRKILFDSSIVVHFEWSEVGANPRHFDEIKRRL